MDFRDLSANVELDNNVLMITVRNEKPPRPMAGWGGGCIENASSLDLSRYTSARLNIQATHDVRVEFKLERENNALSPGVVRPLTRRGVQRADLSLTGVSRDTLGRVKRGCFVIVAHAFPPAANEVTLKIGQIRFQ